MDRAGWEWKQAEEERRRANEEALQRCAEKGVDKETLKQLAREVGLSNWKPQGEVHAAHE